MFKKNMKQTENIKFSMFLFLYSELKLSHLASVNQQNKIFKQMFDTLFMSSKYGKFTIVLFFGLWHFRGVPRHGGQIAH